MSLFRKLAVTVALASTLLASTWGRAQDPAKPKDDALDSLLEKLEDRPSDDSKAKGSEKSEGKTAGEGKPASKGETAPAKGKAASPKDEVAPKDKALDGLLEKLGETEETPAPDDRRKEGQQGGPEESKPPGKGEQGKDVMKKPEADLDRHLEELTGRKPKKSGQDKGEGSGPLSEIIKEMRDVEERLGKSKPDTGDETRRKQTEIVKRLDTLIEQMRDSSNQKQGKRRMLSMEPAKPGSKPGETPGAQAGNAPLARPKTPDGKHSQAGGKSEWGHLPPELRQELENVFKEEELPARISLIRRYFLSLDKKYLTRGE